MRLQPGASEPGVVAALDRLLAPYGALGAVRAILPLAPAEAMRPPAPLLYRVGALERLGVDRLLGGAGRMVLRELRRRPLRALLSSVGIALGIGIVVLGSFQRDAMETMIDVQFFRAWREDLSVTFVRAAPARVLRELARLPGVTRAEGQRYLPVRYRVGPRYRDGAIVGHEESAVLRRVLDREGRVAALPADGLLLSSKLAAILGVRAGEVVRVEVKEGARRERDVRVVALLDDAFGLMGHMGQRALHRLVGEEPPVSVAMLRVDARSLREVEARLEEMPGVIGITRRLAIVERFRAQSGETMRFFTATLTAFAAIITIGVVYNDARGARCASRPVAPGAPIFEVGDPTVLEVVVDILTSDAVAVRPGARVELDRWGGDSVLRGRVRLVEPSAFTRISALGVEEQRVDVVVDLVDPRSRWAALGDGYRVEARIVDWESADVLRAPASSVFRRGTGWALFRVEDGVARLRPVVLGRRNGLEVEVLRGLAPGARVVTHPSDRVVDGTPVVAR